MRRVLVFGASGAVGRFLLPLLHGHYEVLPASRSERPGWIRGDLNDPNRTWPAAEILVSLGPLDAFAAWMCRLPRGAQRVLAFSSMSAQSKAQSPDPAERELAERLRRAETALADACLACGSAWTIFRPTLIYGAGVDHSLAPVARFARRWHLLPIPLGASGLRQPVHAADLAGACTAVLEHPGTHGKTYALGGGERLPLAQMLGRLRAVASGPVVPIPVPRWLLRLVGTSPGVLARFGQPLLADNSAAADDFGYAPKAFAAADVLPSAGGNPA
jgi:nucleoside-diphosphate-sugar epimerase